MLQDGSYVEIINRLIKTTVMSFDVFWSEIKGIGSLPEATILEISKVLTCDNENSIIKNPPKIVAKIIAEFIEDINCRKVKKIEKLLKGKIG